MSPLARRRLANFRANRRAVWSLWIFSVLFGLSLIAEVIANDKPILVSYRGDLHMPI
ncbi:MAG: ABC transporter permease, partial [Pseudomonadota bacterium]